MGRIVELNQGPFVGAPTEVTELVQADGDATVLDVRSASGFVAGHVHGALNVPVDGSSFATKAGFLLDPGSRIVVQASSTPEAARALAGLHSVGFLEVAGYVLSDGGPEEIEPVSIEELDGLLENGAEVIDVRERDERDEGYIAGTRNIPYRLLPVVDDLPVDRPVVTICESGARAGIAASILAAKGVPARPVLDGGVTEWAALGGSVVEFRRCGS
jgi:rhodanese-related sulfurtransferase